VETILLMSLAACLVVLGIAGLLFPAMPGAPLMFLGLVLAAWAEGFEYVGITTIVLLAVLAILTYIVDVVAGILGARRYGASARALAGAGIGALVGLFFGIPGVLFGPFVGAFIGELTTGREIRVASRSGIGTTIGILIGTAAKMAIAVSMLGVYAVARFA